MTQDKTIVILTGSGISAESGVPTFRGNGGLWCSHRIEDVATPEAYRRNPTLVQEFYNMRRRQLKEVQPNAAHLALAELASAWKGKLFLVTQNVDDLHERADDNVIARSEATKQSSTLQHSGLPRSLRSLAVTNYTLLHMHGELRKARCDASEEVFAWDDDIMVDTPCPCCKKPGRLRPHIVWFGEMPLYMDMIYHALQECDLFLSIGTSGNVYPAAGFVHEVRASGRGHTAELNMEPSNGHTLFEEKIYGPATQAVPDYVKRILAGGVISA